MEGIRQVNLPENWVAQLERLFPGYTEAYITDKSSVESGELTVPKKKISTPTIPGNRPTWDIFYMEMAKLVSSRATCRIKVGCVVTQGNRLLSIGYNGAPSGMEHCTEVGCEFYGYIPPEIIKKFGDNLESQDFVKRCQRSIHAEQNAIGIAAANGISLQSATWYLYPFAPCQQCQLLMSVTQPRRVVYPETLGVNGLYTRAETLSKMGTRTDALDFQ